MFAKKSLLNTNNIHYNIVYYNDKILDLHIFCLLFLYFYRYVKKKI